MVILTSFVSIGTAIIPYARARAEAAQIACQHRLNGKGGTDHPSLSWGFVPMDETDSLDSGDSYPLHGA